jgi:phospholipid N-methyltransferase
MNTLSYIRNFKTSGTIASSPAKAISRIVRNVKPDKRQSIVEMGSGTGAITRQILDRMHPESILYCFEINQDFVQLLENIGDKRLRVIPCSALDILSYIKQDSADVIISSLPLSFFRAAERTELLYRFNTALKADGTLNQLSFLYFPWYFSKAFHLIRTEFIMLSFPPSFMYYCTKAR